VVNEIDLLVVLPLCVLAFFAWVGFYLYITLTVMRLDPREIKYRNESGKNLGILPDKLFTNRKKNEINEN